MTAIAGLSIRLYLDVNIHLWIAKDLTARGFDAVHAIDLGHERLSDEHHLRVATDDDRTVFSYDRGDYQRLAREWAIKGTPHAGILLSSAPPRLPVATVHRRLLGFLDHVIADEMIDQLRWLDDRWSLF